MRTPVTWWLVAPNLGTSTWLLVGCSQAASASACLCWDWACAPNSYGESPQRPALDMTLGHMKALLKSGLLGDSQSIFMCYMLAQFPHHIEYPSRARHWGSAANSMGILHSTLSA